MIQTALNFGDQRDNASRSSLAAPMSDYDVLRSMGHKPHKAAALVASAANGDEWALELLRIARQSWH